MGYEREFPDPWPARYLTSTDMPLAGKLPIEGEVIHSPNELFGINPNNPLDRHSGAGRNLATNPAPNPLQLPLVRGRAGLAPPLTKGGWEGFKA
jgi:hypothetical protein